MNITGFNEIAEDNNFVVCYPDGLNNSWNADMNSLNSDVDDIGFVEELFIISNQISIQIRSKDI